MSARSKAEKILQELNFDFTTFTMGEFVRFVSEIKGREIISVPWNMPIALFGAWISDADEAKEYIFYRNNVSAMHQIHIQLHELSHFLFGHSTLQINRKIIREVVVGTSSLPFSMLPKLRSPQRTQNEVEAETLANLIQERAIRSSQIENLIHDTSPKEKLANFLKTMSLT